jgi:DNA-binding XRE family transcriptional regulator
MAISDHERAFFVELGLRVAELRKQQNITQVQLAETLEVSQQTMQGYEAGTPPYSGLGATNTGERLGRVTGGVDGRA